MTLSTLGIDISKLKFDVALLRDNGKFKHRVFLNTPAAFFNSPPGSRSRKSSVFMLA